jgi:LysM repeat protein
MIPADQTVRNSTAPKTPPPPPPQTDGSVTHTVQRGETVGELSTRYDVSEKQILAANPQLRHPNDLSDGQQISIPVANNGGHLPTQAPVHAGDTLTSIAKSHQVSVTALAAANGIQNPNEIRAGTSVWIPVKGGSDAGVVTSANPLQQQISAVDSAVKTYKAAHSDPQRRAASAAITQAAEKELTARAAAGLPKGQSPSDSQLTSYGTAITSRYAYASDPAIVQAVQQGVRNDGAAIRTTDAVKQVEAAQQAVQLAGPGTSPQVTSRLNQTLTSSQEHLISQSEQEIATRAGLQPGQLPSADQVQKYGPAMVQRYAGDPAAAKAVNTAVQTAPADIQAQHLVAQSQGSAGGDPAKALTALNQAYVHASPQVQQRILAQSGSQTIIQNAAAQDMHPLSTAAQNNGPWQQTAAVRQSLANLDKQATQLQPTLAAALVNQSLPALHQFNTQYAQTNGGSGMVFDPIHSDSAAVKSVMDLSGHIAGTPQGDQAIAQLAKIGFWNNITVSDALSDGASAAYPEALARLAISRGQDPTNVVATIQDGVQANQQRVQDDVQKLGEHSAELNWLIQNVGPAMTAQQLQTAIAKYSSQNGWSQKNDQLTQQVIADATTLTQNMKALTGLAQADPQVAADLDVQGTISSVLNDKATSYGLALAAGQNPGLFADHDGQSFLNLVSALKLGDQGRKTAQLIGSMYVRSMITKALDGVDWHGPDPLGQAQGIINSLKSPALSNWMGINDKTVWNSAVKSVTEHLVQPGDDVATKESKLANMDQALNKLKALSASTPAGQLLRSVAVAYAVASTVNDVQKFKEAEGAPEKTITAVEGLTAAAGLLQKGANLANGFGVVKSGGLISAFAKDTANGTISMVSGALDLVEGVRSFAGLGEKQDMGNGVFSTMSGLGGMAYGASQFAETGVFDAFAESTFGVAGGTFAAGLGLVGVGVVAAGVLGSAIYKQNQQDHQYEGSTKDFLQWGGGYSGPAADALSPEGGLLSGAGGVSGVPFLAKYAAMEPLSPAQLQQWIGSLKPDQIHTLDKLLLQTAGDSDGNVANFTAGPEQKGVITDYSSGFATVVTLNNTLGVFQNNLKSNGIPLPP